MCGRVTDEKDDCQLLNPGILFTKDEGKIYQELENETRLSDYRFLIDIIDSIYKYIIWHKQKSTNLLKHSLIIGLTNIVPFSHMFIYNLNKVSINVMIILLLYLKL